MSAPVTPSSSADAATATLLVAVFLHVTCAGPGDRDLATRIAAHLAKINETLAADLLEFWWGPHVS